MAKSADILPQVKKIRPSTYNYLVLDSHDRLLKGKVKADNEAVATQLLLNKGVRIISLEPAVSRFTLEKAIPSLFGSKPHDIISFSRQLATLTESGVTLVEALELIQQHTSSRSLNRIIAIIVKDLRTGLSFSAALSKHPETFSEIYCRTVNVAEQSGKLETILRQLADFQEKQGAAIRKVKGALTYPAIVFSVGIIVVVVLMSTVLPSLIDMFESMETDLPLPTKILIEITDFMSAYKYYMLIGAVVLVAAIVLYVRSTVGRLRFDRYLLRAPVVGPPIHSAEMARVSQTMSVLLDAGLRLQEIMEMLPATSGNSAVRKSLTQVHTDLVQGGGISEPMARDHIFPPLLNQMVAVGEETNTLSSTLGVAANFYTADAEERVDSLVRVITPAATIVISLLVGWIAVSVIMPIYSIAGQIE